MTEEEWDKCTSAGAALEAVKRYTKSETRGHRRKYRLLGCYVLRQLQPAISDPRFSHALDVAERYFDNEVTSTEFQRAIKDLQADYFISGPLALSDASPEVRAVSCLEVLLEDHPYSTAYSSLVRLCHWGDERLAMEQVALIRELFWNPFRPIVFAPEWRSDTAVSLAKHIYEARDFSTMPILADALQDAGCDNADVLNHCRDPQQVHVRGCWVVDGVLGKS